MLNDIVNSIKATLYDRTSSPLFGAFAVSWAVWNYRILVVLTSGGEFQSKLKHIDDAIYPTWWHVLGIGVAGPVATALAFIYIYPRPARAVYEFSLEQSKKLRELRQKIEGVELLTVDESRELRQRYLTMQIEFDRQIKSLQGERDASESVAAERAKLAEDRADELKKRATELEALRRASDDAANSARAEIQRLTNQISGLQQGGTPARGRDGGGATPHTAMERAAAIAKSKRKPTTDDLVGRVPRDGVSPQPGQS